MLVRSEDRLYDGAKCIFGGQPGMAKKKTTKTIQEINRKIKEGKVVVVTADEMTDLIKKEGAEKGISRG